MIVYTANFDGYDRVPPNEHRDVKHVLFTDEDVKVSGWHVKVVERRFDNPAKDNRFYKLQPHVHFPGEVTVYMDACMKLWTHPRELLHFYASRAPMTPINLYAIEHPLGHTLPMEFDWVQEKGFVKPDVLQAMRERYMHVPQDQIGIEARLLIHMGGEHKFFDTWWNEVREYAHRDQISFHYARHHTNPRMFTLPMPTVRPHFRLQPHAKGHR